MIVVVIVLYLSLLLQLQLQLQWHVFVFFSNYIIWLDVRSPQFLIECNIVFVEEISCLNRRDSLRMAWEGTEETNRFLLSWFYARTDKAKMEIERYQNRGWFETRDSTRLEISTEHATRILSWSGKAMIPCRRNLCHRSDI